MMQQIKSGEYGPYLPLDSGEPMRGSAGPEERACARENICRKLAVDSSFRDQREDVPCKHPAQTKSELKVDKTVKTKVDDDVIKT